MAAQSGFLSKKRGGTMSAQ